MFRIIPAIDAKEIAIKNKYHVTHESQSKFSAEIIMNPRDAMVVVKVLSLLD